MTHVIETGGKQYRVNSGDVIKIEIIDGVEEGDEITFDKVLLSDDGKKTSIGSPYLEKEQVKGKVLEKGRDKKVSVIRFRPKSRHFKNKGHRQPYLKVKIT